MKEVRYFYVPNAASAGELPEEEAKHAVRVLRLQSGDRMILADGEGGLFDAEVSMASGKHCMYNILEQLPCEREWNGRITLAIAPTKMMDRIICSFNLQYTMQKHILFKYYLYFFLCKIRRGV